MHQHQSSGSPGPPDNGMISQSSWKNTLSWVNSQPNQLPDRVYCIGNVLRSLWKCTNETQIGLAIVQSAVLKQTWNTASVALNSVWIYANSKEKQKQKIYPPPKNTKTKKKSWMKTHDSLSQLYQKCNCSNLWHCCWHFSRQMSVLKNLTVHDHFHIQYSSDLNQIPCNHNEFNFSPISQTLLQI